MTAPLRVALFGAGGHAKVVADILERAGARIAFVVDDDPARAGGRLLGYEVIGGREALRARRAEADAAIVAIGANAVRRAIGRWLAEQGFALARAIHPAAVVARDVRIGAGSVMMAGAVINADTEIGEHCIVNTSASVDHDCRVGDAVHIAPGARLCGGVEVGAEAFVGAGAVIAPGRRIGAGAMIAAGAVVLADVPERARVAGNPARLLPDDEPTVRAER
ncbi:MAG: acetyltransferase [Burkholderiales bacterium]|nr:acetyltransferase [Burkholderiales bacterium]